MNRLARECALLVASLLLSGCTVAIDPAAAGAPPILLARRTMPLVPGDLGERRLQTRRFDTSDEHALISAGAAVLQDLGFILESDDTELGVLVGSKHRSAVEARQEIVAVVVALLLGIHVPTDQRQKIRVSLVTRPGSPGIARTLVRVTFQRIVWNDRGMVTKMEPLNEPKFYSQFFALLSKAVYLEAHDVD